MAALSAGNGEHGECRARRMLGIEARGMRGGCWERGSAGNAGNQERGERREPGPLAPVSRLDGATDTVHT